MSKNKLKESTTRLINSNNYVSKGQRKNCNSRRKWVHVTSIIAIPKSCNSKVDILCNCGHTRNSALSNIVLHEQFKCKECIKIKKSTSIKLRKNEYKNNFERTIISFENRFLRSNKYRDDFNPNNISKTLECRECKIHKPLYRFYNRRGFNGGKEKLCKNCVDNNRKRRVQNYSKDQVISCILNACRQKSNERSMKGRPECGIIDIDL